VGGSNVLPPALTALFGGPPVWASLRPEAVQLRPPEGARIIGVVTSTRYLGSATRLVVDLGAAPAPDGRNDIAVLVPGGHPVPDPGVRVGINWDQGALHPMAAE
jgi:putative spermidine/putrescine transport system ATP-binding protein